MPQKNSDAWAEPPSNSTGRKQFFGLKLTMIKIVAAPYFSQPSQINYSYASISSLRKMNRLLWQFVPKIVYCQRPHQMLPKGILRNIELPTHNGVCQNRRATRTLRLESQNVHVSEVALPPCPSSANKDMTSKLTQVHLMSPIFRTSIFSPPEPQWMPSSEVVLGSVQGTMS